MQWLQRNDVFLHCVFFCNKFQLTNQVRQSIKNINSEMDETAKEFSKLFKKDTKNLQIL